MAPSLFLSFTCSLKFLYFTRTGTGRQSRTSQEEWRASSIIAKPGILNGQSAGAQSHMEVVTFDPAQAYPEFIIQFTEK